MVALSGIFFVTTDPAPTVTLLPIVTSSTTQTFGPIYTLSPITAAFPLFAPIYSGSVVKTQI